MKKTDVSKLAKKIHSEYCMDTQTAYRKALQTVKSCPAALYPNLCEWAEERPLTDIYVGKYSLPMILSIWQSRDFLHALKVMTELYEGHTEAAEIQIWRMRR